MARRTRRLSDADRLVWAQVTGTARPLREKPAPRVTDTVGDTPRPPAPSTATRALVGPPSHASQTIVPAGRPEPILRWTLAESDRPAPIGKNTPGVDGGTARKMSRGQRQPEARLDLHGMTADRAHAALGRFIVDSAQAGLRCVLVVTGMGRSEDGRRRGDGVLRREVPRWLHVPPLSGLIVGVFEAHQKHGGAGALYVLLKRQRRGSGPTR
jgi:DNA-nicking Smr family endonuclease